MRALFTFLLAVSCSFMGLAQVSISQADMPVSGDTLRYSTAATTGLTVPTSTGQGQTWNYANLVPRTQGVEAYKGVASINPFYALTFGFTAYGRKLADTIGVGPVQATDVYDFFRRNATSFSAVGRALNFAGLPLPSNYTDVDEIYTFPLVYGDRDSTTFKVVFNVAGQGSLTQQGSRVNTVLGEGNITTPYGTFAAILVKVVVDEVDTLTSSQLPFPIGFPNGSAKLVWLARGQKFPILEMTLASATQNIITGVRYRDIYRQLVPYAPKPNFTAINRSILVGDSVGFINLTGIGTGPVSFSWDLTPATGWAYTFGTSATSRNPFVKFTQPGVYSVGLRSTVGIASADTVKADYITVNPSSTRPTAEAALALYPNPATDAFTLRAPASWQARTFYRVDALGKATPIAAEVTPQGLRFSAQGLANGLYFLHAPPQFGEKALHLRFTISRN